MVAKILLLLVVPCFLFMQTYATTRVLIVGKVMLQVEGCHEVRACSTRLRNPVSKRDVFANYYNNQQHWVSLKGDVIIKGCYVVRNCRHGHLGSMGNPASSCKAIKNDRKSAKSGVYYIKTHRTVTKVYCYMEDISGCGGGGWTTIMKTNGNKKTFPYSSAFWSNKKSYKLTNGQSGVDDKETKLPTYWTLPFKSLCLGMKTAGQKNPRWIRLDYKASSLYSVIADGKYRQVSIGRKKWMSLIAGSSLQTNCNKEGFNVISNYKTGYFSIVRIGISSNNENDCKTNDSHLGFGGDNYKTNCRAGKISTGNCAKKNHPAYGYILAQ
ncbi:uncharacterized protein LOC110249889 [Exaiptasia diaphana]|uniref:Fibrinogen C-terminal domain-containing protein n=1 Tax=Exaiptasia diaphana TaxID=2652724 RepID=A0A913YW07_EXADI|nr:uncharacterized protein LOC110249889 [Exaiptasia diaphana]